ncbi:MAG TPA: zf-HC2 domain-containing protein [Chloroflexia bacterium]|nr:zf-HC2 domain-containing protein [Chloroflexia bacterium]
MSSPHVRPLLSAYLDGEVTPAERAQVERHLAGCVECARVLAEYRQIGGNIRGLVRPQPPLTLHRDVWTAIEARENQAAWVPALGSLLRFGTIAAALVIAVLAIAQLWPKPTQVAAAQVRYPQPDQRNLGLNTEVDILFAKPVSPTQDVSEIVQTDPAVSELVPQWLDNRQRLLILPLNGWAPNTTYTVTVLTGTMFTDGQPLGHAVVERFTTGNFLNSPTPTPTDTAVPTATETPTNTPPPTATPAVPTQPAPPPATAVAVGPTQPVIVPPPVQPPALATVTPHPQPPPPATVTPRVEPPAPTHTAVVPPSNTPAPVVTHVPPPATPVPPSATAVPPTATHAVPSATPSPFPPEPTATLPPPPPTMEPTAVSLPPTPTGTPTATADCRWAPQSTFGQVYRASYALRNTLGCPTGPETAVTPAAVQSFQGGWMFWDGARLRIYAFDSTAMTWTSYADTWREGDPPGGDATPPAGLYEPIRGFGKVWREHPDLQVRLGWATAPEAGVPAALQTFERGGVMLRTDAALVRVLYGASGGAWEQYSVP